MKTHNLVQGSPEWLAYRAQHFNASEAAAMLGLSKTTTRTELLHTMHTGLGKEFSAWVQRNVLDYGHEVEAMVRPMVEAMIGEPLYPVTCSEGKKSASLDGLTMSDEIAFECKQWNAEIAAQVAAGEMPEQHMPQCQQILMITKAKKVIFAVGDGTPENLLTLDVLPDPAWFQRIDAGWAQFEEDLAAYVPVEKVATPIGRTPETLPALHIEVTGMVTASNLAEYKAHALAVFAGINRNLVTDSEFANAESTIKWCSDIETRVAAAKQHALSQTASIDELFNALDDISAEARATRLELNNLVKNRKDTIRLEIVRTGKDSYDAHILSLNQRIGRPIMSSAYGNIPEPDFAGAIKGKRTLDSMRDAVATELARTKISANEVADRITLNLRAINEQPDFGFLFSDVAALVLKEPEFVAMVIKNRIADHQAKEVARLAAETARIAEQERVKAEAAATARANAEIAAATAAAQADAARASAEAIAKAAQVAPLTLATAPPCHQTVVPVLSEKAVADRNAVAFIDRIEAKQAPSLSLGQISERLGFNVTSVFLATLGFEATTVKAAKLFQESDFPRICQALVMHINRVNQGVTA